MLVTDKNFYKQLLRLSIPLILQALLSVSVDTVNVLMLGSISQSDMTAVAQANQITYVFRVVALGFAAGTAILTAQYWGTRNKVSIQNIVSISFRVMLVYSAAVSMAVAVFPEMFMRIYSNDAVIIEKGSRYLRIAALSYVPVGVINSAYGACRGVEKVRIIPLNNLITYSINIFISCGLLFGRFGMPAFGIEGIAIGAVISRILEMLIILLYMTKFEDNISYKLRYIVRKDRQLAKDYLRVTAPLIGHEFVWSVGTTSGSMITGNMSSAAVAGYDAMMVFYNILAAVGDGLLFAGSVVTGVTIGQGRLEDVKKQARSILAVGFGVGCLAGIITLLSRGSFLKLYALDGQAYFYADKFMLIIAAIWPFSLLEMTGMAGILRAGGDGRTGFIADIIIMWILCIPAAFLAAFKFNANPVTVVILIKLAIVFEALVAVIRIQSMKWIHDLTRKETGNER